MTPMCNKRAKDLFPLEPLFEEQYGHEVAFEDTETSLNESLLDEVDAFGLEDVHRVRTTSETIVAQSPAEKKRYFIYNI